MPDIILKIIHRLRWFGYKDLAAERQVSNMCLDIVANVPDIIAWLEMWIH